MAINSDFFQTDAWCGFYTPPETQIVTTDVTTQPVTVRFQSAGSGPGIQPDYRQAPGFKAQVVCSSTPIADVPAAPARKSPS